MNTENNAIKPEKLDIQIVEDTITIEWKWYQANVYILPFLALVFFALSISFLSSNVSLENSSELLFPVIFLLIAIILIYFTLLGILNKTKISLNPKFINIVHYPIPWFGNKTIQLSEIKQIGIDEQPITNKSGEVTSYLYIVVVRNANGTPQTLCNNLDKREEADFVVNLIRQFYKLNNE